MSKPIAMILLFLAIILASNSVYVMREIDRGVQLRFGEVVIPDIEPGLHWKVPFMDNVRKFDGRVLTVDAKPERFLTQLQKAVIVDSYAKFRVSDTKKFYTATNGDIQTAERLLAQRINNGLRDQVGARTVQEVVSGERDELMDELTVALNVIAQEELGVEIIDVRVKGIDLPDDVSDSVYRRMNAERKKEADEHRAQGDEFYNSITAAADRKVAVILADAYRDAEIIKGEGDAEATRIYAEAFSQDAEFYNFTRSLKAYQESFQQDGDILLVQPESEFFKYLKDAKGGNP